MNSNLNTRSNRRASLALGAIAALGISGSALACDPADFDMSGHVGLEDLAGYLTAFLAGDKTADSNADGKVTVQDLFDFVGNWITRYIEESQVVKPIDTPIDTTTPAAETRDVDIFDTDPHIDRSL